VPGGLLARAVPAVGWLRAYRRADLPGDLTAGVTVAVMLVPQATAYAMLAGLPPEVGLYAATVPLVAYALFGSSRQLAVGPVAMVSLLVASGCEPLAEAGSERYIALAALTALLVGAVQFVMGLLRLGVLVNFVSHAVISGFTSAAAIIIGLSQAKRLLGVDVDGGESFPRLLRALAAAIPETHGATLLLGLVCIAALVILGRAVPRIPGAIAVCAAAIVASPLLGLENHGIRMVGHVPQGLPPLSLPVGDWDSMVELLPTALTISLVGFMESVAVVKFIAARERQKVEPSQELIGLGLANAAAAVSGGYPVTGGLSRTAVNYRAGARTGLAGLISAALVLAAIVFLTPAFRHLPKAVLAAIIVVAVAGLLDPREPVRLFRVRPRDGYVLLLTFAATLGLGIEPGLLLGVALSLAQFIWRSAHPHMAELGLVEGGVFRNIERYPDARAFEHCLVLRVDASLYFANMAFVDARVREAIAARPGLRCVVLDLSAVNDVDAVGVHMLEDLLADGAALGIRVLLAGVKGPVRDVVSRVEWDPRFEPDLSHPSVAHALVAAGLLEGPGAP